MSPVRLHFALIGAGKMGTRWASAIAKSNNASLDVIADTGSGKAKNLASQMPGRVATQSLRNILKNKEIDAVIIATPHRELSSISAAAIKAGKHVLCEKPGAIRSIDIKKNIALAKNQGLTYMIGYNHRFHDGFIKARRYYQRGAIGKILFIRARYGFGGRLGYNKEWRLDKAVSGGGHLLDQGVHMIDLAKSFMADIKEVRGIRSDNFWKKGVEDNAFVLLQDKNKVLASIHASLTQWQSLHNFEIYGSKGYLSVEGLGMKYGDGEKLVVGKQPANYKGEVKQKVIACNSVADDSLGLELQEFIAAIRQKRQTSPSPEEAYETLKIVETVYKGSKL